MICNVYKLGDTALTYAIRGGIVYRWEPMRLLWLETDLEPERIRRLCKLIGTNVKFHL